MANFTNYNELMRKAFKIANERGIKEQKEFDAVIMEVFQADKNN